MPYLIIIIQNRSVVNRFFPNGTKINFVPFVENFVGVYLCVRPFYCQFEFPSKCTKQ